MESPYITKTSLESSYLPRDMKKMELGATIERIPSYYYYIRVFNSGRSIAKNCVGYVEELHYFSGDGNYNKSKEFLSLPLAWAHEGHSPTYINPKQEKYLDIGYISKEYIPVLYLSKENMPRIGKRGDIVLRFCFDKFPFGEVSELWGGTFKIKISVYSENTKAYSGYLKLKWTGNWSDEYDEMKKEIQLEFKTSFSE